MNLARSLVTEMLSLMKSEPSSPAKTPMSTNTGSSHMK
jgi:hypothetical protein